MQPHPLGGPIEPPAPRFVTLRVPAAASAAGAADAAPADVVLARAGDPPRADALVLAREPLGYAVRRVARVTDDAVELLGDDLVPRRVCGDARAQVVGTVLLRWHVDDAA
jgi:hypothetical protein